MNPPELTAVPTAVDRRYPSVTVVVPMDGEWAEVSECITSILEHVDSTRHTVILVNDAGEDAAQLEEHVLQRIARSAHIHYVRNVVPLGAVGSCNRAVTELDPSDNDVLLLDGNVQLSSGAVDELVSVLHAAEHHGLVSARSNSAGIATIPHFHRPEWRASQDDIQSGQRTFDLVSQLIPRWYISPGAVGGCILIRRALIDNHGLVELGSRGVHSDDFSLRMNALGYSSLIANRVFVTHTGTRSPTDLLTTATDSDGRDGLPARHHYLADSQQDFLWFGYAAPDVFAEIGADARTRSILLDLQNLSAVHNGSNRYAMSVVAAVAAARLPENVSVTIAAQADTIAALNLERYGFRVAAYDSDSAVYDVGIALSPVTTIDQLIHLNDRCARWVLCHYDMISARSWQLRLTNPLREIVVEDSFRYADRVVSLSRYSLVDAAAYYPELRETIEQRGEAVLLGSTWESAATGLGDLTQVPLSEHAEAVMGGDHYVVIMGNFYPHKQVARAVAALQPLGTPVLAFGPVAGLTESANLAIVKSGDASDAQLRRIIEGAALVVFPSAYEGYGLPVADALDAGVPVVVFDTAVSREVVDSLGASSAVRYFDRFAELANLVADALADEELHRSAATMRGATRGLAPHAARLLEIVLDELEEPLDWQRLSVRYTAVKRLERVARRERAAQGDRAELAARDETVRGILASESYRIGHAIVRVFTPVVRVWRRVFRVG